jgi:hypothetical protein
MMRRLFTALLLIGLIALGYWLWTVIFPKPEQIIRNRLNKLARLASFSPDEGNFKRVANVQRLGRLFDENVQVVIETPGGMEQSVNYTQREELMQAALAAKRFAKGLKAEFLDVNINVAPDEASATADLVLRAKITGESDQIVQGLKFTLKNTNSDWLITRVETVKSLKP